MDMGEGGVHGNEGRGSVGLGVCAAAIFELFLKVFFSYFQNKSFRSI